MRKALLLLALALSPPRAAHAIFGNSVGGSTAQFLRIGAGARALGMGEAYGPVAEGPDALYWNPAGLAMISRPAASYTHVEMLEFFHHDHVAYAHPVPWLKGTVGVSATMFYQDAIPQVTNTNQRIGEFGAHSEAFSVGYARGWHIGDRYADRDRGYFEDLYHLRGTSLPLYHEDEIWEGNLLFGMAAKVVQETLQENSSRAYAFDGGVLFRHTLLPQMAWSAVFKNIGTKARFIREYESLPAEAAFGLSYDARFGARGDHRFLPAFEVSVPYYGNPFAKLGAEYTFPITLEAAGSVRFGYKTLSASDLGALSGLTGGVGLRVRRLSVDFAFQQQAVLGEAYRIGLGWRF